MKMDIVESSMSVSRIKFFPDGSFLFIFFIFISWIRICLQNFYFNMRNWQINIKSLKIKLDRIGHMRRAFTASLSLRLDRSDRTFVRMDNKGAGETTVKLGSHVTDTFIHSENSSHFSIFTNHLRLKNKMFQLFSISCAPYTHFYSHNLFSLSYTIFYWNNF